MVGLLGWGLGCLVALAHGYAVWQMLGGWGGLTSNGPLARHDHPLYFHSAWVTRAFLRQSGTTAGYDPYFMAGYPKSVIFPASSTLPELALALAPEDRLIPAYKWYVGVATALVPWILLLAARAGGLRGAAGGLGVLLALVYIWTDWPINYPILGMVPYFLAIPAAILAGLWLVRYLEDGGAGRWVLALAGLSLAFLIHLTTAMLLVPAGVVVYILAWRSRKPDGERVLTPARHAGFWLLPILVLALNAFWWWPGVWLASTKGDSTFAFSHSEESVWRRLFQIIWSEAPIEALLASLGLAGLGCWSRQRLAGVFLAGFAFAGFFWGYLAAWLPSLDFLQPGRHTFAFYLALALGSGWLAGMGLERAGRWGPQGVVAVSVLLGIVLLRWGVQPTVASAERLMGNRMTTSALSSIPSARMRWVLQQVERHMKPGERLLYEEGGFDQPGEVDAFSGGRFSGLLPYLRGIEVLGGPYLHAAVNTNDTQFGEGKLFGKTRWKREDFVRGVDRYAPVAICCWSRRAVQFCRENSDLVEILDEQVLELPGVDPATGQAALMRSVLVFGRIRPGALSAGVNWQAARAFAGRLQVELGPGASELDRARVLRYHMAPWLRSRPPLALEAVNMPGDPVPFIGLPGAPGSGSNSYLLEMDFPP